MEANGPADTYLKRIPGVMPPSPSLPCVRPQDNGACKLCADVFPGCDTCADATDCTSCQAGYYKVGA